MWELHIRKLTVAFALLSTAILTALHYGIPKTFNQYDWFDILGEGTVVLVTVSWLFIIVQSRPKGPVTNKLFFGGCLLAFSCSLDVMDEFFHYAGTDKQLMNFLESIPAPTGMLLLTFGIAGWLLEQKLLYRQLHGRELFLRNHRLLDPLTTLYSAEYLQTILHREQELHLNRGESCCLLVLDINQFSACNKKLGAAGGDKILKMSAELILSQLRSTDVLCRYAGDRFMAVLPHTSVSEARLLGRHIQQQMRRISRPDLPLSIRTAALEVKQQPLSELLHAANRAVSHSRRQTTAQWQTI
ncbi:GGDEF domain-containing protein [Chromatiaceae bacterium AAb-1]|nr:GGDEF domain-containing protein [Chromatiaceae bacterium AAb-1]